MSSISPCSCSADRRGTATSGPGGAWSSRTERACGPRWPSLTSNSPADNRPEWVDLGDRRIPRRVDVLNAVSARRCSRHRRRPARGGAAPARMNRPATSARTPAPMPPCPHRDLALRDAPVGIDTYAQSVPPRRVGRGRGAGFVVAVERQGRLIDSGPGGRSRTAHRVGHSSSWGYGC
jgi:hypothetical protein